MSREAMEAAQDNSGVDDPFAQNILIAIGRFVAADTKRGWCSDRVVADVAKCDKGSVGAWRSRFEEMGIVETWTTGAGRGTKRWYQFLFPFESKYDPVIGESYGPDPDNKQPDIIGESYEMKELMSEIRDLLYGLPELLSEIIVRNVRELSVQEHHNTKEEHQEHHREAPPQTPASAIITVVEGWCSLTGRKPPRNKELARDDYGIPAESLLKHEKIGWNTEQALSILEQARKKMLADGYTPVKLSGVIGSAFGILDKPNMNGQHPAGKQEDLPKVIGEF